MEDIVAEAVSHLPCGKSVSSSSELLEEDDDDDDDEGEAMDLLMSSNSFNISSSFSSVTVTSTGECVPCRKYNSIIIVRLPNM